MTDASGKAIYYISGKSSGFLTAYNTRTRQSLDLVDDDATQPAISPDGKHVMYIVLSGPRRQEVWLSDIDGGNKVKLASGDHLATGQWSRDGTLLNFVDQSGGPDRLYVARGDGGNVREVPWNGLPIAVSLFSSDDKFLFISSLKSATSPGEIWRMSADGSSPPQSLSESCGFAFDISPDGKYLATEDTRGKDIGFFELSTDDDKCSKLVPDVSSFGVYFAPDAKSLLYAVTAKGSGTIYRQPWSNGKLTGPAQVAYKIPFAFSLSYGGNGYDFARDLSTIVYARPGGQQDLYSLTQQ